jgi:NTP pyrophosphatase (non-canonical NTP hydrolase)
MDITQLVNESYKIAKDHGFWDKDVNPLEKHMLMVSEIAEATEEARKCTPPIYQWVKTVTEEDFGIDNIFTDVIESVTPDDPRWNPSLKSEGELIELADTVIRIADYCGYKNWDLEKAIKIKMEYNKNRPYKHGKAY